MIKILFPAGLVLIFCICYILYLKNRAKKIGEFANFMKITNRNPSLFSLPRFTGKIRDKNISIFQKTTGSGKYKKRFTIIELPVKNSNDFSLELSPEFNTQITSFNSINSLLSKVKEKIKGAVKVQDIKIGDKNFDETFVVKGSPENIVKIILNRKTRSLMLGLKNPKPNFFEGNTNYSRFFKLKITSGKIYFEKKGHSLDCQYYSKTLDMLFCLIDEIENKELNI